MNSPFKRPATSAFSLVECTIALGIVSFVLVSLIGLLPTGLEALKASTHDTLRTQMVETVANRLRERPFHSLANERFYFDQSGALTSRAGAAYEVAVEITEQTGAGILDTTRFRQALLRIQIVGGGPPPDLQPIWLADTGRL